MRRKQREESRVNLITKIKNQDSFLNQEPQHRDLRIGLNEGKESEILSQVEIDGRGLDNYMNEILNDNIRLKEELNYLKGLINDIRNEK